MNRRRLPSKVAAIAATLTVASTLLLLEAGPAAAGGGAPQPPANLRVTDLEPELITLAWAPVTGAVDYRVQVIPLEAAAGYARFRTTNLTMTLDDLTWDIPYQVTVRAYVPSAYPHSYTEASTIAVTTPLPDGYVPPGAPTGLRVERDAQGAIAQVRWDAADGFGPLTYRVHLESEEVAELTGVFGHTTGLSFAADILPISGGWLAPGQSVAMWITAVDQIYHQSPPSEALTLTCCPL
jgi:hypothetical protein